MLTFEQARAAALKEIGSKCALVEEGVIERRDVWFFPFQSKEYLETGDRLYQLLGILGLLVEKSSGKTLIAGGHSAEQWLAAYEAGFLHYFHSVEVTYVYDRDKTIELVRQLPSAPRMKSVLRDRMAELPAKFVAWGPGDLEIVKKIEQSGCCKFDLVRGLKVDPFT